MRGTGQRQRVLAVIACMLWLLGVEAFPAIHLAHHEADHSHDAMGTIVHHGDHDHTAPAAPSQRDLAQLAIDHPVDPGHQADGVAHHAVALHQPYPVQLPFVVCTAIDDSFTQPLISASARAVTTVARGPPQLT
jgi:hypothetical protein